MFLVTWVDFVFILSPFGLEQLKYLINIYIILGVMSNSGMIKVYREICLSFIKLNRRDLTPFGYHRVLYRHKEASILTYRK